MSKFILASSVALLLLSSQAAQAQSQAYAPASFGDENSAQHTEAMDVATLNGQLVKVGEKNKYRTSHKQWNVSVNPFTPFFGAFSGSISKAIGSQVAVRGEYAYAKLDDHADRIQSAAAALPIYFTKTFSGVYLEPGVSAMWNSNKSLTAGPQLQLGYQWYWDSNVNLSLAVGIGKNITGDNNIDVFPTGTFQLGYAFGQ